MISMAQMTLWIQLFAVLVSSLFYYMLTGKKDYPFFRSIAQKSYYLFSIAVTVSSVLLMYFFLTHNYRLQYVADYSSRDLPLKYLISSFWAGQEGSFLLWVFISAWLGILLRRMKNISESHVMTLYNLQNLFLTILLIKQSPFRLATHTLEDGFGLNMLLQDPWMVIHPPIVFLGYAAYAIPFAIAMASLWQRKYDWVKKSLSWVSFAFFSLGAGIIIGGVWSYKVLGWGGYWGWDPVENASLLPWLSGTALLHGMLLQSTRKHLAKTNYFLAAFSFVLIIYSTFLTRSGVLADFSVHSFTDLGITGWLVFFMAIFLAISAFLLVTRAKEIPHPPKDEKNIPLLSLEFGLIGAVVVLCLSAVLTGLGTSAPLITRLTENPSKVSIDFYVNVNLPIAIIIGLLLSYIPLLKWGQNDVKSLLPRLITGIIIATITTVLVIVNGFPGLLIFLMIVLGAFTTGVNLEIVIRRLRKGVIKTTAAVAHLGLGLMLVAFVTSTVYDKSERVALSKGKEVSVFGYSFEFQQATPKNYGKGTKWLLPVTIKNGNTTITGVPDIYIEQKSPGNKQQFHHPFIIRGWWTDLYVSPETYQPASSQQNNHQHVVVKKGETAQVGDYSITFMRYDLTNMNSASGHMSVGAELQVSYKGEQPVTLMPVYTVNDKNAPGSRVKLPGNDEVYAILTGMNASEKTIDLHFSGLQTDTSDSEVSQKPAFMVAEISTKPGMLILWIGVTLLLLGGAMSVYRRWPREKPKTP